MRADVAVVEDSRGGRALPTDASSSIVPVLVPTVVAEDVHERFLTIRSRDDEVVAVIEILSPTNKRSGGGDGRQQYLAKRERVLRSTAHLIEIDLLRAGERVPMRRQLPPASYYVIVSRAEARPQCEVYPIQLRDRLPTPPLPLRGEESVRVDLQAILDTVFDRAGYDAYLDREHGPVPPLEGDDDVWARGVLGR